MLCCARFGRKQSQGRDRSFFKDMTLRLDADETDEFALLTPAQLQRQKIADLTNFATSYLEKLIHLVVPVPRGREDSVDLLLGVKGSPSATSKASNWRRLGRTAASVFGTVLIIGLLMSLAWLAIDIATNRLPELVSAPVTATSTVQAPSDPSKPGFHGRRVGRKCPNSAICPACFVSGALQRRLFNAWHI